MLGKGILRIILKHLLQREKPKKGREEKYPDLSNCIVCGLCSKVCPTGAIRLFKFREVICENCGVCIEVCPTDAITLDRFKVDRERCIGCGYCLLVCTIPVIKEEIPRPETPVILEDRCNHCGFCIRSCPEDAIGIKGGRISIEKDRCKMCLTCIHLCPMRAISSPEDYVKSLIVDVDIYSCISCRECEYLCPIKGFKGEWDGDR